MATRNGSTDMKTATIYLAWWRRQDGEIDQRWHATRGQALADAAARCGHESGTVKIAIELSSQGVVTLLNQHAT